jgi:hypothetical protein
VIKFLSNVTDSPVVIDAEGHVLGGGEWGHAEVTPSLPVSEHIEAGRLVVAEQPADDGDPQARAAWQAMTEAMQSAQTQSRRSARSGNELKE